MARPRKEGLDYFPHDVNASSDGEKVEVLHAMYGNDGYALYFILLEHIYRAANGLRVSDAEIRNLLASKTKMSSDRFNEILETAVKIGCFCKKNYKKGILTSNGIKKRVSIVVEKRNKMKELYSQKKGRISSVISDAETKQKREFLTQKCHKVKESKVKESKVIRKEITYPEWLPLKEFQSFKNLRKQIRKPLTEDAEELLIKELEKLQKRGNDPKAVLEQSIMNSWQGVFELKNKGGNNAPSNPSKYDKLG